MSQVRSLQRFAWGTKVSDIIVDAGDVYDAADPLVKATPAEWWEPVPEPAPPKKPARRG